MKYDAVVLGSGVSGMTAALLLARHGQRVAIVEKHATLAPLLRRFRREGVWCNPGFHYSGGLLPDGCLTVLLRYLGAGDSLCPIAMDPDGFDTLMLDDGKPFLVPTGLDRLREALCERFPASRHAVEAYTEEVGAICDATPFVSLDADIMGRRSRTGATESLDDFLARAGAEEELRDLLSKYGYVVTGALGCETPMDKHGMLMGLFCRSAHTLTRGGDEIVETLEKALDRDGVTVYRGRPATRLRLGDRREIQGVEIEGGDLLECATCFSTVHPQILQRLLDARTPPLPFLARLTESRNTFSPLVVFLDEDGAGEPARPQERHANYYSFRSDGAADAESGFFAVLRPGHHGTGHPREATSILAPMPSTLQAGANYSPDRYEAFKAEWGERVLGRLRNSFPSLSQRARTVAVATPRTYERMTGTIGGAAYGIRHRMGKDELTARTDVRGLYLAGQSVLMTGVIGSMVSSFLAVAHVVDIRKIWDEVRQCR